MIDRIPESIRFKFRRQKEFLDSERTVFDSEYETTKDPDEIDLEEEEILENLVDTRARSSVKL